MDFSALICVNAFQHIPNHIDSDIPGTPCPIWVNSKLDQTFTYFELDYASFSWVIKNIFHFFYAQIHIDSGIAPLPSLTPLRFLRLFEFSRVFWAKIWFSIHLWEDVSIHWGFSSLAAHLNFLVSEPMQNHIKHYGRALTGQIYQYLISFFFHFSFIMSTEKEREMVQAISNAKVNIGKQHKWVTIWFW